MRQPEIKTKRLILRALRLSDYANWYDAFVNGLPPQNKFDFGPQRPSQCSLSFYKKLLQNRRKQARLDSYYSLAVFEKKTNVLVGEVDFDIFSRGLHQFASFGYTIYNRHVNQGYGTEACSAGLDYGFKILKLNRLEAAIHLDNRRSIKLATRIGMRRECVRQKYYFENGQWVDQVIYALNSISAI